MANKKNKKASSSASSAASSSAAASNASSHRGGSSNSGGEGGVHSQQPQQQESTTNHSNVPLNTNAQFNNNMTNTNLVNLNQNNLASMRNMFANEPVNLDSCFLCDDHKPKKSLSGGKKGSRSGIHIPASVKEFWLEAPLKKKLQLLQMDCKFVLDQIRCSSPYTTKEGDKPAFLSKPSSCLCPACRKKKAIFNAVIAVFEDYVNELEGKPPSANSTSHQVAATFPQQQAKSQQQQTNSHHPHQPSSSTTPSLPTATATITLAIDAENSSSFNPQPIAKSSSATTKGNNNSSTHSVSSSSSTKSLVSNETIKQLSKISEKAQQFIIEDEPSSSSTSHEKTFSDMSASGTSSNSNNIALSQADAVNQSNLNNNHLAPPNDNQLPFGRYLIAKNGKITVSEEYLKKDNGRHFLRVIKKCEEVFPSDLKLGPNNFPAPENIHMLINYCTMNSELNIKKIMLKNAKKALSNHASQHANSAQHKHHAPQHGNTSNVNSSSNQPKSLASTDGGIREQQQVLNLFHPQQGGNATATLTLGSNNGTVNLNNVNVQMIHSSPSDQLGTSLKPVKSSSLQGGTTTIGTAQVPASISTHLQVQVPPTVTITATSASLGPQKSSGQNQTALVVSGSIDMTTTGSGSSPNMKVVNGSIAMVHLGNVKDLIRAGDTASTAATVMLNSLHDDEDIDDDDDEDVDEEEDDDDYDEDDTIDDEEHDDEDDEEAEDDDDDIETDGEEEIDEDDEGDLDEDYTTSETDEEGDIHYNKGELSTSSNLVTPGAHENSNAVRSTKQHHSLDHHQEHIHSNSKRRVSRESNAGGKRHASQKSLDRDPKREQEEKNEILASNMRESKLLFQIYLARLFAHNIRVAYNDLCASEMQKCLLEEYERESEMKNSSSGGNKSSKKKTKNKKDNKKNNEKQAAAPSQKKAQPSTSVPSSSKETTKNTSKPTNNPQQSLMGTSPSTSSVASSHSLASANDTNDMEVVAEMSESADESSNDSEHDIEESHHSNDEHDFDPYEYALDEDDSVFTKKAQDWNVVTKKPTTKKQKANVASSVRGGHAPRGARGGGRGRTHSSIVTPHSHNTPNAGTSAVSSGSKSSTTATTQSAASVKSNTSTHKTSASTTSPRPSPSSFYAVPPSSNTSMSGVQNVTITQSTTGTSNLSQPTVMDKSSPHVVVTKSSHSSGSSNSSATTTSTISPHQFHSQHVKPVSSGSPANLGNSSNASESLSKPVPTLQTNPSVTTIGMSNNFNTTLTTGGFILLPSAVNGANIIQHSSINSGSNSIDTGYRNNNSSSNSSRIHSRQQSTSSTGSNLEISPLTTSIVGNNIFNASHPSCNASATTSNATSATTPGNSTVSSVVDEILNDDDFSNIIQHAHGSKRSHTPSSTTSNSSSVISNNQQGVPPSSPFTAIFGIGGNMIVSGNSNSTTMGLVHNNTATNTTTTSTTGGGSLFEHTSNATTSAPQTMKNNSVASPRQHGTVASGSNPMMTDTATNTSVSSNTSFSSGSMFYNPFSSLDIGMPYNPSPQQHAHQPMTMMGGNFSNMIMPNSNSFLFSNHHQPLLPMTSSPFLLGVGQNGPQQSATSPTLMTSQQDYQHAGGASTSSWSLFQSPFGAWGNPSLSPQPSSGTILNTSTNTIMPLHIPQIGISTALETASTTTHSTSEHQ